MRSEAGIRRKLVRAVCPRERGHFARATSVKCNFIAPLASVIYRVPSAVRRPWSPSIRTKRHQSIRRTRAVVISLTCESEWRTVRDAAWHGRLIHPREKNKSRAGDGRDCETFSRDSPSLLFAEMERRHTWICSENVDELILERHPSYRWFLKKCVHT